VSPTDPPARSLEKQIKKVGPFLASHELLDMLIIEPGERKLVFFFFLFSFE
jgi:hypothetical protein